MDVIKEALRLSASSINSQPWKFIILESDEAKHRFYNSFGERFLFNQGHARTASHIILFAHKVVYSAADYDAVMEKQISDGRMSREKKADASIAFNFVKLYEDEKGQHTAWTKNQTYIALGMTLHTLARMGIDSTAMEGINRENIKAEFAEELEGYECHMALAMGYHHPEDRNATAIKSRLACQDVILAI